MTSVRSRILSLIPPHSRAGSLLLIAALLAGALTATIGAGYSTSRPQLENPGVYLTKSDRLVYVNAVSGEVEAETLALVPTGHPTETVTLTDGRVTVFDTRTNHVWLVDTGTMTSLGSPIAHPGPYNHVVLVSAPDGGYVGSGDVVTQINEHGRPENSVRLPGKIVGAGVPDPVEGIWVLIENGDVVHIVRDTPHRILTDSFIRALTVADDRPIGVTDRGELLEVSAQPPRRINTDPLPTGDGVRLGSVRGQGRWITVLDTGDGHIVAVDGRTGTTREFRDLPSSGRALLGEPVQAGDRVYVPDYELHRLHVRDLRTGQGLLDIEVPGKSSTFSLEVRAGHVWANDQFDRRAVTVSEDGVATIIDKGEAPGLSDTSVPGVKETREPPRQSSDPDLNVSPDPNVDALVGNQPASTSPSPKPAVGRQSSPMVEVPAIEPGTDMEEACERIRAVNLRCVPVAVGTGGMANTVATDPLAPPAGSRVPESSQVVVRHYDPIFVPVVVGEYSDTACDLIETSGLTCVREPQQDIAPTPEQLDVVTRQTPEDGKGASSGDHVAITFYDSALLLDYDGWYGTAACTAITDIYRTVRCQVIEGPTKQESGKEVGFIDTQQPAPGQVVRSGDLVTLTVVKGTPGNGHAWPN